MAGEQAVGMVILLTIFGVLYVINQMFNEESKSADRRAYGKAKEGENGAETESGSHLQRDVDKLTKASKTMRGDATTKMEQQNYKEKMKTLVEEKRGIVKSSQLQKKSTGGDNRVRLKI